jgi:hypothetical protein
MAGLSAEYAPDEPRLVRANPGERPEVWVPEDWPVERRVVWARWARTESTGSSATSDAGSTPAASTTFDERAEREFFADLGVLS